MSDSFDINSKADKAIVSVVVDKALYSFDNKFDYYLPQGVTAKVGQRVIVPFGKGGKKRFRNFRILYS